MTHSINNKPKVISFFSSSGGIVSINKRFTLPNEFFTSITRILNRRAKKHENKLFFFENLKISFDETRVMVTRARLFIVEIKLRFDVYEHTYILQ